MSGSDYEGMWEGESEMCGYRYKDTLSRLVGTVSEFL